MRPLRLPTLALSLTALGALAWSSTTPPETPFVTPVETAQDGITVVGVGSSTMAADRATVRVRLAESAELASEALDSLKASTARLTAAVESVAGGEVTMARGGVQLGPDTSGAMENMFMVGMEEPDTGPEETSASEVFTLSLASPVEGTSLTQLVAETLEVTAEAGAMLDEKASNPEMAMVRLMMGQTGAADEADPPVQYHTSTLRETRSAALAAAMADARSQALELANLAGVNLGKAASIQPLDSGRAFLETAGSQPNEVQLQVRFAID